MRGNDPEVPALVPEVPAPQNAALALVLVVPALVPKLLRNVVAVPVLVPGAPALDDGVPALVHGMLALVPRLARNDRAHAVMKSGDRIMESGNPVNGSKDRGNVPGKPGIRDGQ